MQKLQICTIYRIEKIDMTTNFVLLFLCLFFSGEIDSSEVLDGLETDTGLGDLKYCNTMIKEK